MAAERTTELFHVLRARSSSRDLCVRCTWEGRMGLGRQFLTDGRPVRDAVEAGAIDEAPFSVWFEQLHDGRRGADLIWSPTSPTPALASHRFVEVLTQIAATGWRSFDVPILHRDGAPIEGYVGFAVTGRIGDAGARGESEEARPDLARSDLARSARTPQRVLVRPFVLEALLAAGVDGFDHRSEVIGPDDADPGPPRFQLSGRLATRDMWIRPSWPGQPELGPWLLPDGRDIIDLVAEGRFEELPFDVRFSPDNRGSRLGDVLWAGGLSTKVVSQRFVELLAEIAATGWRSFPVDLRDRAGNPIDGYVGFATTGDSDAFDVFHRVGCQNSSVDLHPDVLEALLAAGIDGFDVRPYDGPWRNPPEGRPWWCALRARSTARDLSVRWCWEGKAGLGPYRLPDGRNIPDLIAEGRIDELPFEVWFEPTNRGARLGDMIWTTGSATKIVSFRFVQALAHIGATGWRTFPVRVRDRAGNPIEGYAGLTTTGGDDDLDVAHLDGHQQGALRVNERVWNALVAAGVDGFDIDHR